MEKMSRHNVYMHEDRHAHIVETCKETGTNADKCVMFESVLENQITEKDVELTVNLINDDAEVTGSLNIVRGKW